MRVEHRELKWLRLFCVEANLMLTLTKRAVLKLLLQKLSPCHLSMEFENKCACSIENGRVFVLKQNADSVKACGMKITLLQKNLTLSLVNRI